MTDYAPNGQHWSIMTKSYGGTVSVVRGLTLDEARKTYERLDVFYGQISYKERGNHASGGQGVIEIREVFGPPGWSMDDLNAQRWPRDPTPGERAFYEKYLAAQTKP